MSSSHNLSDDENAPSNENCSSKEKSRPCRPKNSLSRSLLKQFRGRAGKITPHNVAFGLAESQLKNERINIENKLKQATDNNSKEKLQKALDDFRKIRNVRKYKIVKKLKLKKMDKLKEIAGKENAAPGKVTRLKDPESLTSLEREKLMKNYMATIKANAIEFGELGGSMIVLAVAPRVFDNEYCAIGVNAGEFMLDALQRNNKMDLGSILAGEHARFSNGLLPPPPPPIDVNAFLFEDKAGKAEILKSKLIEKFLEGVAKEKSLSLPFIRRKVGAVFPWNACLVQKHRRSWGIGKIEVEGWPKEVSKYKNISQLNTSELLLVYGALPRMQIKVGSLDVSTKTRNEDLDSNLANRTETRSVSEYLAETDIVEKPSDNANRERVRDLKRARGTYNQKLVTVKRNQNPRR